VSNRDWAAAAPAPALAIVIAQTHGQQQGVQGVELEPRVDPVGDAQLRIEARIAGLGGGQTHTAAVPTLWGRVGKRFMSMFHGPFSAAPLN
jgi:hypothetical protein